MHDLDAPITAVTVHPTLARVTRTGGASLPAGATDVVVAGLPATLDEASLRVTGRGSVPVRVVGVEVASRRLDRAPDERVAAAEASLRAAERALGAVVDEDTGEAAKEQLLLAVADRGGKAFAEALATGSADAERLRTSGTALAADLQAAATRRRQLAERRADAERFVEAARFEVDRLRNAGRDRRDAIVSVELDAAGDVTLELAYVVGGAGWRPTYDVRVDGDGGDLHLTWGAVLSQATGEHWPECALAVSTAQPQVATAVPELDPWWIDAWQPVLRAKGVARAMAGGAVPPPAAPAPATMSLAATSVAGEQSFDLDEVRSEVVETTLAATWVLPRPKAVPSDGASHRAVLATAELEVRLDHITAPVLSSDVHLRATVTNDTGRALLPGTAAVFLDDAFVGTATIEGVAPGAEFELALGVDDRVVVERELVSRDADKKRLGSVRGARERWRTEVTNHRAGPISLVVRDRVPYSRHADIKVKDVSFTPPPAEVTERNQVEWKADVAPGATYTAELAFAVEHPRDLEVSGWR